MRKQPQPLDPLSLARTGMATWITQMVVAQKVAEAVWSFPELLVAQGRKPHAWASEDSEAHVP